MQKLLDIIPSPGEIKSLYIKSDFIFHKGQHLVDNDFCTLTAQGASEYKFTVEDRFDDFEVAIRLTPEAITSSCNCHAPSSVCSHKAAALIALRQYAEDQENISGSEGETYSEREMVERVLKERHERAEKEDYRLAISDNIYGFHKLRTQSGITYEITIRDFKNEEGYCSCPDFQTNKLGTCKHLIYAIAEIKKKQPVSELIGKQQYPFLEIYCDPHADYQISYFYQRELSPSLKELLDQYFGEKTHIYPADYGQFMRFISEAQNYKEILIRPEVTDKIDKYFERQLLNNLSKDVVPDFSKIKAKLFDYQKEGVFFNLFKSGAIIADEMGLGKTLQAITTAVLKKDIYDLQRTLIICPASLKAQWKKEIERFSSEKAEIIEGNRSQRRQQYAKNEAYFLIANYEAVMRDVTIIRNQPPDMIILDEAQRIKNYDTKTSHAVKSIPKKHALVITGTPLENRLLDLYSIMNFIDPELLAPQWAFSMQYCLFDKSKKNRITGYYNLQHLKKRLEEVVIRREKKDVLKQLPDLREVNVPVELHPFQADIHAGLSRSLAAIIRKKHKTLYDMQRIQQLLTSMRMVCDSSYLIDKESNYSPKLDELKEILLEKLDIKTSKKKVIIFSEWKTMLHLISNMLRSNNVNHLILSGDVPVKNRGRLIDNFANDPDCLVMLSTEAGGTGLNLQFADTVVNFDLPWNPAKKNQRIGRINRIGQQSAKITAINLISLNSIEAKIAEGIELKENLFEAVLNEGNLTDEVDFAAKGRSTFIDQIQKLIQLPQDDDENGAETEEVQLTEAEFSIADEDDQMETGADIFVAEDDHKPQKEQSPPKRDEKPTPAAAPPVNPADVENTLNQGLQFLSGIFKMATGQTLKTEEKSITVDRESGEVTMKFKLPGF